MTPLDQFLVLLTPVAVVTAIGSGIAFALVIHGLRPTADPRLITFLVVVLSVLWYGPQFAALWFVDGSGYGTLGRWALFLAGFTAPMWLTLRWRAGK